MSASFIFSGFVKQEIGLASLGAPDEWIDKLATVRSVCSQLCKRNVNTNANRR